MAGYTRQSVASIINGADITAPPLNAEFNQLLAAFDASTGHSHDGTTGNSPKINLATSVSGFLPAANGGLGGANKLDATTAPTVTNDNTENFVPGSLWENVNNGRVYICVGNSTGAAVWRELVTVITGNIIEPVAHNTIDLGKNTVRFKDLYLQGGVVSAGNSSLGGTLSVTGASNLSSATLSSSLGVTGTATLATVDINGGNIDGTIIGNSTAAAGTFTTITTTGLATLPTVDINAGAIDGTVIGGSTAAAITGTTITASTGFTGTLTGNVTGNLTGNVTGNVTGDVTGNLTGNVSASSGNSTFNNVTVNGTLDVTGTTIANVTDPVNAQDAATKNYVDTADALKLNLSGGTMSGDITMGGNTVTGLGTPSSTSDATTKSYVDTADALKLNLSGGTMSGAIAMGNNKITGVGTPTAATDAANKAYVDAEVSAVIDAAPGALDTLNELAAAINDDANFSTTITNSIATKLPLAGGTMSGDISLGANKATSTATPATDDTLTRKGYVDTQDALKVSKSGDTMTGDLSLGANKATSTATPATDDTLTRKGYVDTQDATKLNLSGGTMSGAIAMGTSKITGLGDPTAAQDAATKTYVDTADAAKLNLTGGTLSGNLAMGSNNITGLATPTANDHATNKSYVDGILGSATSAATSATNAANSATAAASSATSAATSATNAAASYDSFDDRYLGAKSSAPSTDNDGDALVTGALYWNSTNSTLNIWDGSAWADASFADANLAAFATAFTLPTSDGSANQVLQTNGSGTISFGTIDTSSLMPLAGGTFTGDVTFTGANYNAVWDSSDNSLEFEDGAQIRLGSSSDLTIYHSANSLIDNAAGDLYIRQLGNDLDVIIRSDNGSGGTADYIRADGSTGEAILYHYGSEKLATKTGGIDVTGRIDTSGTDISFNTAAGGGITFGNGYFPTIFNATPTTARLYLNNNASTKQVFYANSTGMVVGNGTSPTEKLDVQGNIAVTGTVDGVDIATNIPATLGTAGQVLTVNAGATAGEWADAAAGTTTTTAGESATARYIPFVDNATGTSNETVRVDAALSFINNSAAFTGDQKLIVGQGSGSVPVTIMLNGNNNGGSYTPELLFYDGDTGASTDQKMGRITFQSADTGANGLARIEANVKGGLDPNDGSRIIFSTKDDGGTYAERLRITEGGALQIGTAYTLPTSDGSANQVLTTDGSGAVTFADAAGGGGTADFVASGTIANGDTVILNSDGTVSVAGNYGNGAVASRTDVSSAGALYQRGTYDSNADKLLVVYQDRDNSNYGTAVVGTVSGTTITFGTPVVYNSASTQRMRVIYCSTPQKSMIVYENFGDSSTDAIVATISGTTVTFGTKFDVKTGVYTDYGDVAYDPDNNRVLFAYWDGAFSNSGYGRARLLYISGTSIGGGTTVTFNAADSKFVSTTYDTNENKFVITYRDGGNSGYGTSVVGTVSGTSISFGTPVVFLSGNMVGVDSLGGGLTFDSTNNKIIAAYGDSATNSGRPTIQVGTVSGTSITWGTKAQFAAVNYATPIGVVYDAVSNKIIANYRNSYVTDQMRGLIGTVSGTTVTFEPEIGLSDGAAYHVNTVPVSGGIVAAIVNMGQTNPTETAIVEMAASNITDTNFLGLAAGAISDTATGAITITGGTNTAQSSLTVGEDYFIADNGTLTTTNNGRKVGRATATTKILVNPALLNDEVKAGNLIFTASGAISAGDTVIVSGNNTVSKVAQSGDPVIGTVNAFNGTTAQAEYLSLAYDTNSDKVVLSWQDEGSSSKGTTLVGTVNGNSITFGDAVVFEAGNTDYIASCFDSSNNKIVIAYRDTNDTNQGKAIVGTVSGNSISFGTEVIFETGNTQAISCCFDSTNNKVVIMYVDADNSGYVTGIVGTVSGTSISFGTPTVAVSSYGNETSCVFGAFDGVNSKVAVQYVISTSNYAIVGTVSGTSISFGTSGGFIEAGGNDISTAFDSDTGKVIFGYKYSNRPAMKLGTVSGTSITYGSRVYASSQTATHFSTGCAYDPNTQKIAFFYRADSGGSYAAWMNLGTVSGTSVTFGTEQQVGGTNDSPNFFSALYDPDSLRVLLAYEIGEGVIQTIATTGTNASKFIGLAKSDIANGATGIVNIIGGLNTSQTGLTAGTTYFVKDDGTLGTGDTGVRAGIALSTTDLLVKG